MEEARKLLQSIEWKIESEKKRLDKMVEEFKECSAKYDVFSITTFIPGKVRDIAESKARLENLYEQRDMVQFLLRQMEV